MKQILIKIPVNSPNLNQIIEDVKASDERLAGFQVSNNEFVAFGYNDKDKALKNHSDLKAKHQSIEMVIEDLKDIKDGKQK
jgi:hypothetical protein